MTEQRHAGSVPLSCFVEAVLKVIHFFPPYKRIKKAVLERA